MMRRTLITPTFAMVVALLFGFAVACAKADGDVAGGDLTEAGTAATVVPEFIPPGQGCKEAEESADASSPNHDPALFKPGTTWTDLYNDIFKTQGKAGSCGFKTSCHGAADSPGSKTPNAIVCVDQEGCYQSMIGNNDPTVGPLVVKGDPDASVLVKSRIRHCVNPTGDSNGDNLVGDMPQQPIDFIMPSFAMDRVRSWIDAGAPNN